jgi:hypothetical protein
MGDTRAVVSLIPDLPFHNNMLWQNLLDSQDRSLVLSSHVKQLLIKAVRFFDILAGVTMAASAQACL